MKKEVKYKKTKIFFIILLVYLVLLIIEKPIYEHVANNAIDRYIEAQGLKNEEVISDSGLKLRYYPTGGTFFNRNIEYKNNPGTIYVYYIAGRKSSFLPFYNIVIFKDRMENDIDYYKGVSFEIRAKSNAGLKDSELIEGDWVSEGELDSNGKLLREIPWKD